ncbi:hypothetical protein [Mesorhizobium sp.]|uniref:hypothetical protein n=1 Tax=Mesorhizobium sp. TaxID=1871066 RepID=UPI000FE8C317|nr:hypothetical protein [Mesorhizobium sp.]RWB68857.1 MAG: hypothetical protein EOQ49_21780 [Mesorhizobium sp.]RWF32001.1 MAG: hypothetical protein EOS44_16630 [Mesorhizobium sp.]TIT07868.1 MAG: hypothetical protein E5W74_25115 [Mesorhizobium sp.]TIV83641.1 MAG: hypothetical protein E5V64_07115 [Mesorhizobium sp.]
MNVTVDPPVGILHELEQLARAPATDVNHLQNAPAFLRFVELCQTRYPHIRSGSMLRFSLASALRQLGLACLVGGEGSGLAASATEIADRLDKAIRSTTSRRLYLCPLDLASDLPAISFGPNQVRRFSATELEQLFDVQLLHRAHRDWSFDSGRFSQFNWLVVEEQVTHDDKGPEGRRLPGLFVNLGQDFGRIEPHKTGLPPGVEAALFGLLTIPWERIGGLREMEWRGFGIPWVYTLDSDVFARRVPPPSPDSLSWEPAVHIDAYGDEHEYERPISYPLDDGSDNDIVWLNDSAWRDIVAARQTELFDRPVAHFFVRGFRSDGIDEFLAHISTIEAALGLPLDHDRGARRRIAGKNPGATYRVTLRISGLLKDGSFGHAYSKLFGLRSDFLHGKSMADISGDDRRSARELAREVVCELLGIASANPNVNREQLLDGLLDRGSQLNQHGDRRGSEVADGH